MTSDSEIEEGQTQEPAPSSLGAPRRRNLTFAAQELRLISALVLLLAIGLFLALPFVLSIGSVVFLPLVAAIILSIVLSPLADRLTMLGLPNVLASFLSMLAFLAVVIVALLTILRPAVDLYDRLPAMLDAVGRQFSELRGSLAWVERLNDQLAEMAGRAGRQQVVIAEPSIVEELAIATPSLVIEIFLTFLMAFFMIQGRTNIRSHLLMQRSSFGTSVKAARAIRDVQDRVAAYIITVSLINLGVGIVVALGAWALGMDAPVMWGGLAALLNFLPYVGPAAMVGLLALFGLATYDTFLLGLIPAATYLGLHTIESNIVTPSILGARFTMNPVLILIALSYFTWIWGVAGALLSVPILLTLTALVDHLGKPNLVGFVFGEPLFATSLFDPGLEEGEAPPA